MRLLIVSHTPHHMRGGQLVGWGATVREIDQLAARFSVVRHIAPLHAGPSPASARAYHAENVTHIAVPPAAGLSVLREAPGYLRAIRAELPHADLLHIRLPAAISALALLLMALPGPKPSKRWFKYAGSWQPTGRDHLSYRLQRALLRGAWHGGVVTVNGAWAAQPPHVHTLNNPSLTAAELQAGAAAAHRKRLTEPAHIVFVGRVERAKGAHLLIPIAQRLQAAGVRFHLHVIGEPHLRLTPPPDLPVTLHGALPRERLNAFYAAAHVLLLPSRTEGWPKVISEGLAYGVVPVASAVGAIPQTLQQIGVGRTIPPGDVTAAANTLHELLSDPVGWQAQSAAAVGHAHQFSYTSVFNALAALLD